ncbi:MAG: tRNA uridine-5-carboxymethylaminomethyl(34) synthesis GTPase MnmE [Pseudomonadota bacterium]
MGNDTIFALATPPGKSGVAIVRVSGPSAFAAASQMVQVKTPFDRPRLRRLWGEAGDHIDTALIVPFAAGASFTGEETVEFHLHGSAAVIQRMLRELSGLDGMRPAQAGEFTRRAVENDRLSLDAVEGLADLIDAETEAQRRQALRVASGQLRERTEVWRAHLIRARALIEATIDFADEEVPEDVSPEVGQILGALKVELRQEAAGAAISERIRDGFEVAIVGPPNVGKSTLLNRLAGRDAALTSSVPGTTRDVIEVRTDLRGLPVTFLDTAGLRETTDEVERMGVARGEDRAAAADIRIVMVDPEAPEKDPKKDQSDIVVSAKADEFPATNGVSGLTGLGVDALVDQVADRLEERAAGSGLAIRERQRLAMEQAATHASRALALLDSGEEDMAILAEELRSAVQALEELTGRISVETVLGEIFQSFCIGK